MSFYLMHRGWMDNPVFRKEKFTDREAWQWLIQEASFEPHKIRYGNKMIEVTRGQIPTSYRILKDKFQWSNDRLRHFLILLQSESMVTLEIGTGFLIVTICNYNKYQLPLTKTGTPNGTLSGTHAGTPNGTNIIKGKELNELNKTTTASAEQKKVVVFSDDFYGNCFQLITETFPGLMAKNSLPIQQWKQLGADFEEHVKPAVSTAYTQGYTPDGFAYFTPIIQKLLTTGTSKTDKTRILADETYEQYCARTGQEPVYDEEIHA